MTELRAAELIKEHAVWDSVQPRIFSGREAKNATRNIVDAIMEAVAEEREACAKIAESVMKWHPARELISEPANLIRDVVPILGNQVAAAIRSRSGSTGKV